MIILARALALVVLVCNAAAAGTLYVSASAGDDTNACTLAASPCKTVGRALDVAVSGDSVQVAPGTYAEANSVINAGDIEISGGWDDGVSDPNGATVIEPRHDRGLAFTYDGTNSGTVVLRDLTIQKTRYGHRSDLVNAYGDDTYSAYGGGLFVLASGNASVDVVIDHVSFVKNRSPLGGGAALIASGDATMTVTVADSVFSRNRAFTAAGLFILDDSALMPTIDVERTVFSKNSGVGAISALLVAVRQKTQTTSTVLLSRLTFQENRGGTVDVDVRGGELDLQLENSVFMNNTSNDWATALFAIAGPNAVPDGAGGYEHVPGHLRATSVNNSVSHNSGDTSAYFVEAGNFGYQPAQIELVSTNDIIYGNAGGDMVAVSYFGAPVSVTRENGIQGPASVASQDVTIVNNNILNVDPRFQSANADLHLRADSPAIDAISCAASPAEDFDGEVRPQGGQCDIGADEYVP